MALMTVVAGRYDMVMKSLFPLGGTVGQLDNQITGPRVPPAPLYSHGHCFPGWYRCFPPGGCPRVPPLSAQTARPGRGPADNEDHPQSPPDAEPDTKIPEDVLRPGLTQRPKPKDRNNTRWGPHPPADLYPRNTTARKMCVDSASHLGEDSSVREECSGGELSVKVNNRRSRTDAAKLPSSAQDSAADNVISAQRIVQLTEGMITGRGSGGENRPEPEGRLDIVTLNRRDSDRKREAFYELLATRYPEYAVKITASMSTLYQPTTAADRGHFRAIFDR
ncbi:hypothetical protein ACOMHN_025778 [Nucella lapillus]